ncbi:ABC transporter permease [Microbispora sp. ATCC PTA-5024]|uniref:ABC transporter permease n=1 Tax=Microbispora sp. ATCC PTA-5024 TaxID=316330 RepID=UPI0003DBA3E0|nr:ABC transporter permease [Microbispora sp. ATCC PTA-5024]ETK35544.1 hypothetical protein MPTA5024_13395 [Microbispora sp. ATCC PTA-5024]
MGGVLLGIAVTSGYAAYQSWPAVVPAWATAGALAATVLIGGVAGLYPAIRAARLSPTEALAPLTRDTHLRPRPASHHPRRPSLSVPSRRPPAGSPVDSHVVDRATVGESRAARMAG